MYQASRRMCATIRLWQKNAQLIVNAGYWVDKQPHNAF